MKSLNLFLTAAALLAGASAQAGPMPSSSGAARQVLTVNESVSSNGTPVLTARVAPLVNSTNGFGTNVLRTQVKVPQSIGSVPPPPLVAGMVESTILSTAANHFKAYGPVLANQMSGWMKEHGVAFAWFTYEQKLTISYSKLAFGSGTTTPTYPTTPPSTGSGGGGGGGGGGSQPQEQYQQMLQAIDTEGGGGGGGGGTGGLASGTEERVLVWTMSTDQNGRLLFGNPKIIAPKPRTLFVVYTPLRVDTGLPVAWQYPNAGTLMVQSRDEHFDVIAGTDELINVNGAFDEPVEDSADWDNATGGAAFNRDAKIPCLMNHLSGGCSNTISVRSLMDQRGASMAVVDYIRKVQPIYDEIPVGSGTMVPRGHLSVMQRLLTYNGCNDPTYYNKGTYDFQLESTATRYIVSSDGTYGPLAEAKHTEQSPTVAYEGAVPVRSADLALLPTYALNPVDPNNPKLVPVAALTYQAMADVTYSGNPRATIVYNTTSYVATGSNRLSTHIYLGCDMSKGQLLFSAGWQDLGANTAYNWTTNVNKYTYGTEFMKGQAQTQSIGTREDPQHGYCSGSATYDGNRSIRISMSDSCAFGDKLLNGNSTAYASGTVYENDGLGSLFPQYCSSGYLGSPGGGGVRLVSMDTGNGVQQVTVGGSSYGCVYDERSGFEVKANDYYAHGLSYGGCSTGSDGTSSCWGWTGPCPNPMDSAVFTGGYQKPVMNADGTPALNADKTPVTEYILTSRSCVKPSLSTYTLSW